MDEMDKYKAEYEDAVRPRKRKAGLASHAQFEKVLHNRCLAMRETLGTKAKEYSVGENRYHNFDTAARILGVTPDQALLGMWMKHIVSVFDMIESNKPLDNKVIDEKIGDLINYAVLLEGLWKR